MHMKRSKGPFMLYDMILLFIDEKRMESVSENTIEFYKYNLNRFLLFLENELGITEAECKEYNLYNIDKFRKMLKSKKKWDEQPTKMKNEKITNNSYRTYTNAIRVFGNWLYGKELIDEDIINSIKLPKSSDKQIRMLSEQETRNLFNQFDLKTEIGLRNYIICWLALDLGLRSNSIASLRLLGVDFNNNILTVWLKGNKIATYPLGKELKAKLREYIVLYRQRANTHEDSLFLNRDHSCITTNTIKQLFKKLKIITGINELGCHYLRHNFATNYVLDGHSMEETQFMLGHTTQQMAKKYVHTAKQLNYINKHISRLGKVLIYDHTSL